MSEDSLNKVYPSISIDDSLILYIIHVIVFVHITCLYFEVIFDENQKKKYVRSEEFYFQNKSL